MKRVFFMLVLLLVVSVAVFGAQKKLVPDKIAPVMEERVSILQKSNQTSGSIANAVTSMTVGKVLFPDAYCEMTTNASTGRNVLNHGDGTMQVAAMTQTDGGAATRSSYWSYFDGNNWLLPMTRVETDRSGWGNIDGFADGRAIVSSHPNVNDPGSQVAIDALKGFGIWTEYGSGQFPDDPGADHTWMRLAIDGNDYIHLVFAYFTFDPFPNADPRISQPYVYARSKDGGLTWNFHFLFQAPGAAPGDPPSQTTGWLTDGDADAYAIDAWQNKVGIAVWTWYNPEGAGTYRGSDILFAESIDYGDTWTYTNATNDGLRIPPPESEPRAGEHITMVYDNNGEPHIVFGTFTSFPSDTLADGTILMGQNRTDPAAPLMHWSPSTGVTQMLNRYGIPGAAEDVNAPGGCDIYQRGTGGGLFWPSIGVDANNTLYIVFNAPTPFDVNADTVNYLDVYATASTDGGKTWGCPPVNITDTRGLEEMLPSLAMLVDDSLRMVYNADTFVGRIGGNGATQTIPTTLVYQSFPAALVPTVDECPEDTTGVDDVVIIPAGYYLAQNYPNPFNPVTEIQFEIPVTEKVSLRIYNMAGQVITTLVDEKLPAGKHHYTWNAPGNIASGVYIYRLEAANITLGKKLIFTK